MGSIDTSKKANRLVTGRRYGSLSTTLSDAQEPFTSTIDTNASEVYVQAHLIPSSSLPFSGSGQDGYWYTHDGTTGAIDTSVSQPANAILRYWFRHRLTETSANNQTVYFFIDPPGGIETSAEFINPQFISDYQVTNFISNKYASGSKALDIAESLAIPGNPGYNVQVTYLTAAQVTANVDPLTIDQTVPSDKWAFDYKTGVLQIQNFTSIDETDQGVAVYVTAYQYVGKTLDTKLAELDSTIANLGPGGGSGNYISSSNGDYIVSASNEGILIKGSYDTTPTNIANISNTSASFGVSVVASAGFTGSLQGTGSWARIAVSASIADNTGTNASYYPVFVTAAGNQGLQIDTVTLSYNPSTNILTTTASSAATASNISTAFVGGTVAPNNQILISNGSGQVTGSSLLSFNPATDGGQITIGNVTIDQNSFNSTSNTFDFGFGSGPGNASYIQITNANNPNLATIAFNMTASFTGPTTTAQSINSTFDDQFILLASASSQAGGNKDSGIVFEYGNTIGTGSALFFDASDTKRLAFRYSASINDTNMAPQAYVNMTFVAGIDGSITSTSTVDSLFDNVGGDSTAANKSKGFMFIDTDGNIYIKS